MPIKVTRTTESAQAARILSSDTNAYVLGGGTGLMRRIHEGDQRINHLIRLDGPALKEILAQNGGIRIGAQVTMAQILANSTVQLLHNAAASVGAPALRNMATIGGNLFARPPYGDLATALLALNAEVITQGSTGEELRSIEATVQETSSRRVVTAVQLPNLHGTELYYHKMARSHPRGASIVTIAIALTRSGGRMTNVRVAFGGLAGRPTRAPGVERALAGTLSASRIDAACARIGDGIEPMNDALASGWYRLEMANVQLRRLLAELM